MSDFLLFPSIAKAVPANTVKGITGVVKVTPHYSVLVPESSDDFFYLRTQHKVEVEMFATLTVEVTAEEEEGDKKKKKSDSVTTEDREVVIKRFPLDIPFTQVSLVDSPFYAALGNKAKKRMMTRIRTVFDHLKSIEQRRAFEESFDQSAPPSSPMGGFSQSYGQRSGTISLPQPGDNPHHGRRDLPMIDASQHDLAVSRIRAFINKMNLKNEEMELTVREFFTQLSSQHEESAAANLVHEFEDKIASEMRRAVVKM